MNLLIIGAGNMGMAYTKAMLSQNIVQPSQIAVVDKVEEKQHQASVDFGVSQLSATLNDKMLEFADVILLAVKPQDAKDVLTALKGKIAPRHVVISIMAGMRTSVLKSHLAVDKVVRAMPNLPLLLGKGMTVFFAEGYSEQQYHWIESIFQSTGEVIQVAKEEMLDAATAVSGTGPAYVFYFIQQVMNAAQQMHFTEAEAHTLTMQTFKGAIALLETYDFSCQEWIKKVASKGGTTEKAIAHFDETNLGKLIADAMHQALKRSQELSNA